MVQYLTHCKTPVKQADHLIETWGCESRNQGSALLFSKSNDSDPTRLPQGSLRAPSATRQPANRGDHVAFDHRYLRRRRYQIPSLLLHATSSRGVRITVARGSISLSLYTPRCARLHVTRASPDANRRSTDIPP